ncbi:MAG: molybdopterin molybdenumtransferase MoeA [Desulfuromonadaceae bacterium GWC2_58_13]|nr:MAG: molybdopterin molybdenumtransferase MoeA [Desulfuromonadaceae bacterium GWC2_58_13]
MSISFEEARRRILDAVRPLPPETIPLLDAVGRAIAEPLIATRDMPRFDNSAMDGYAVRAEDCRPGTVLKVTGYIPAGGRAEPPLEPGCAVRIMTGAPLPPGADAVVPFEETDEGSVRVLLRGQARTRDHIRFRGEDIAVGQLVMDAGTALRPPEISLLASFGQARVSVHGRPRVAILSTGDELVELGQPLSDETIVNSNSWSLAAAVKEIGAEPVMLGIARDNLASLREKLSAGLACDALITSAGVSAGDRDLVREVLAELGVEQLFWKIDIKPGRPTAFGMKGAVPVFSLPGNPVSSMITFEEFARPALLKMMGHRQVLKPLIKATLKQPVRKRPGRTHFLRVTVYAENGELVVASSGDQNTGILLTMLRANAIAILPAEPGHLDAGDEVRIHLLDQVTDLDKDQR